MAEGHRVEGSPAAVGIGADHVSEQVVMVVVRVTVAAGALEPGRDGDACAFPTAGLLAVDLAAVVAGAGDTCPFLGMAEAGQVCFLEDVFESAVLGCPVGRLAFVA